MQMWVAVSSPLRTGVSKYLTPPETLFCPSLSPAKQTWCLPEGAQTGGWQEWSQEGSSADNQPELCTGLLRWQVQTPLPTPASPWPNS